MRERIDYLDKAKGVLIILVVVGHVFQSGYLRDLIYTFHIPAFFIISGMLFNYSTAINKTFIEIIKKRIYTMVIPFLFFELYGCLAYIVRFGMKQSIVGFIYNTIHLNFNNGVNWFLFTLIIAELIFIVILKLVHNNKIIIGIGILSFALGAVLPQINNYCLAVYKILICLFLLIVGYYMSKIFQKYNLVAVIIASIITIVMPLLNGYVDLSQVQLNNPLFYVVGLIFGTYVIIQFAKLPLGKFIKYIGVNTILIYGTHNAIYIIAGNLLGVTDFATTPIFIGICIIAIVFAIELPLVYLFNKYLPFLIGKKIKKSK